MLFLVVLLSSGVLVLLVIGDEVVHVGMLVSASMISISPMLLLVYIPVQEGLGLKHGRELLAHAAEHLLDEGVGLSMKVRSHEQPNGRVSHTLDFTLLGSTRRSSSCSAYMTGSTP